MTRSIFYIRNDQKAKDRLLAESITGKFLSEGYDVTVHVDKEIAKISLNLGRNRAYFRILLPESNVADFAFNRIKDQLEIRTKIHNMDEALD